MERNWKKDITLFIGSQAISLFGSMLVQYAIMWHITLTAKSGTIQTIAIICGFLPSFFMAPFAGVWADRYDRKKLIILSDSLITLTTLVVAILFQAGHESLTLLFVASAVRALGQGIHSPAIGALIPQIVPESELTKVNAAQQTIQSGIMLVSPIIAGALMSFAPVQSIFFIDVVTAVIAVSILGLFLKVPPHERALSKVTVSYFHDLREGFAYIKGHSYVKRFFVFVGGFLFFLSPCAFLTPLQVTRSFGSDVWRLTATEIVFSIGMMGGGILMGVFGGKGNRIRTMGFSSVITGVMTLGLGLVPWFAPYLVLLALIGVSIPMFNTPATVMLQEKVEPAFLGRVFGVMGMIQSVAMPAGMLLFGPLADAVRIEWLLVGSGAVMTLQGFILMRNKVLMTAGERATAA